MHHPHFDPYQPQKYVQIKNPDWLKNATLYEINVRQFSKEGTFKAVEKELPRLRKMGIDIIWLMPIHPIGIVNRKGSLGSFYSVKDYLGVNPEFGTEEDFRHLVETVHAQGMRLILDWVANHSSWDNSLVTKHPEWYKKSQDGNFQSLPWRDYDDIIDFDYTQ
ncbi:alpha-amylase family glycosyl hydrolase [Kaistella carnis]|uniref:alpha-amylase family glycosyl hydrolase n=1 Tax=Kaistella carnis TaxID=1241979 RepID=UPI0028977B96|nr:alpha-amylase family glycosyl hydrolase [Kaistella carnis]